MQVFTLPHNEVLSHLATREKGLHENEVTTRLTTFGYNEIEKKKRKNYALEYAKQYTNFFAVLLEVAAALSFLADAYSPGEGYNILGFAVLGAVIVNATFTFWQEYQADRTVEALLKLIPPLVGVRRDGAVTKVEAGTVVPGDILVLEEGDTIAADQEERGGGLDSLDHGRVARKRRKKKRSDRSERRRGRPDNRPGKEPASTKTATSRFHTRNHCGLSSASSGAPRR
ncbi:cation-transporting P-type ATPase [Methanoculleus sp. FWC-SCC1]|uniref:Cation-transporting P-type ATPase n=1 Tax=Methanoculleus frigidifontis TaxID=2584085 RepID=A0ABT8M9L7_9EURY|nr:cation-transporting P-type ATPase [Methanoculleus sp. FWC-SCC1]MDN7024633.1 cation-transporting P-type ATPase [Methanoculleus sp. FWC-SCC1]